MARLTYPDGAFDAVITQEVIEHLPELSAALAEMARAAGFSQAEFWYHSSAIGGIVGQDLVGVFVLAYRK